MYKNEAADPENQLFLLNAPGAWMYLGMKRK